jgi:ArsR family metal-binding transcriptional regulator
MSFLDALMLTKTLPCLADPGKCIVIGRPSRNLDGVLPLVAAVAPNIIAFNPAAGTLTLRRQPGFITFYPDRVMITQVKDMEEGLELLAAVQDLINQCWDQRDAIQPVTMALAFILLQSRRTLEECPVMADDPAFADRRAQLAALVENESYLNGPTS